MHEFNIQPKLWRLFWVYEWWIPFSLVRLFLRLVRWMDTLNNNFNINKHNQFHRNCGSNSAISKHVDWFGSHSYTTLCHDDIYNSLPITLINYTSRTNNNWIKWFIWWTCHVKRWRSSHQIRWWKKKKMNKKSHHHTNDWLLSWKLPLPIKIRTFGKSHSVPYDANNCSLFSMTMRKGFMSILTFISWYCHIKLSFVRSQKYEWMFLLLAPNVLLPLHYLNEYVLERKYDWIKLNWQKNVHSFHEFSLADFPFFWQWKRTWKMLLIFV